MISPSELTSPAGRAVLDAAMVAWARAKSSAAAGDNPLDPLKVHAELRRRCPDAEPEVLAAALTQARLRDRADRRLGAAAANLFFSGPGLEQATRPEVADRRAARLRAAGVEHVVDVGAGLGLDTLAFARAGLRVTAVEVDPDTVELLNANVVAAGVASRVDVVCADITTERAIGVSGDLVLLEPGSAIFVDPARRAGDRRRKDPETWSPPWSWVAALGRDWPRLIAKVAPGIAHDLPPTGAETTWTSVDGQLVEAGVWWPGLAGPAARRAVVIRHGAATEVASDPYADATDVGDVGAWLLEPDDAVLRAGLIGTVARLIDGRLLDPRVAYVTTDADPTAALDVARAWPVLEVLPFGMSGLRKVLATAGIGRVVIKKRAFAADPDDVLRRLRLPGGGEAGVVFLTRIGRAPVAIVCGPQALHPAVD